jgi:glycosyltransferase involved in cell wall biosynthesis
MDRIIFTDQKHWATENSPAALAGAIEQKFTQNLPAAGLAASMEARERYSWESAFSRLFNIYTEVVNHYSP